jgi:N-methylhydantoinase A
MRIGVDIGGTFTDVVVQDETGALHSWKVASTPGAFADGVLQGVEIAGDRLGLGSRGLLTNTGDFLHGTTVTTNLVVTRTGTRAGLLTTEGFGDGYALARMYRGSEQDPAKVTHPTPLIPRGDTEEVRERVDYLGRVVLPLDEVRLRAAVSRLLDRGIRSFAVCFLWSFLNPEHEDRARGVIRELAPDAYVAVSHETCPIIGEYERTSTTAITAYTGPALERYATELGRRLSDQGLARPILLMKSDGGVGSVDGAVRAAAQTIYSGPAAGVMAAQSLVNDIGLHDLITFDMGGTSTDVAIVEQDDVRTTSMQFLDRQALATPMIDITTVGAGGGSVGWVSPEGELRVGPESAGALPGPACYGRGGTQATVTDANVVLGLIDPRYFLDGTFPLRDSLARDAMGRLGDECGLSALEAARGVFRVVGAVMADAIRLRTVFAGLDPRRFSLVSFGGAGGLHCATVARELRIPHVVIPRMASVFSALGLVSSDLVYSFAQSFRKEIGPRGALADADLAEINGIFSELDGKAMRELATHALPADAISISHAVELSYRGQILDFAVAAPRRVLTADDFASIVADFDRRYSAVYGPGAAAPDAGYAVKTYSVKAVGRLARSPASSTRADTAVPPSAMGTRRSLSDIDSTELTEMPCYRGATLMVGAEIDGPALIDFPDTTVHLPYRTHATMDENSNLHLRLA